MQCLKNFAPLLYQVRSAFLAPCFLQPPTSRHGRLTAWATGTRWFYAAHCERHSDEAAGNQTERVFFHWVAPASPTVICGKASFVEPFGDIKR